MVIISPDRRANLHRTKLNMRRLKSRIHRLEKENTELRKLPEFELSQNEMTDSKWTEARNFAGDSDCDDGNACTFCGKEVEDGVCVFDIRNGSFIPSFGAKFDYFCNHACLSNHVDKASKLR